MRLPRPALSLCIFALRALPAAAAPTRDQQRCLNDLNAAAARVAKAVASTTVACVRAAAREQLAGGGIAACIAADTRPALRFHEVAEATRRLGRQQRERRPRANDTCRHLGEALRRVEIATAREQVADRRQ